MGLDTRAYRAATDEWKREWVTLSNERGWRPVIFGLMREPVGKRNYGLTGGYLSGVAPFTLEQAPDWHQDGLEDLPWPGGLVGGMLSENGGGPSFRGKAYDTYVERVTGRSLYMAIDEPWQDDVLREVAQALRTAADTSEHESLARWFEVCVENDLMVSGDA